MSLKESERLEKEIEEVREMKVSEIFCFCYYECMHIYIGLSSQKMNLLKQKKISTMTADEYFEKHPELRKKFDDEMRNDYWGYWVI